MFDIRTPGFALNIEEVLNFSHTLKNRGMLNYSKEIFYLVVLIILYEVQGETVLWAKCLPKQHTRSFSIAALFRLDRDWKAAWITLETAAKSFCTIILQVCRIQNICGSNGAFVNCNLTENEINTERNTWTFGKFNQNNCKIFLIRTNQSSKNSETIPRKLILLCTHVEISSQQCASFSIWTWNFYMCSELALESIKTLELMEVRYLLVMQQNVYKCFALYVRLGSVMVFPYLQRCKITILSHLLGPSLKCHFAMSSLKLISDIYIKTLSMWGTFTNPKCKVVHLSCNSVERVICKVKFTSKNRTAVSKSTVILQVKRALIYITPFYLAGKMIFVSFYLSCISGSPSILKRNITSWKTWTRTAG